MKRGEAVLIAIAVLIFWAWHEEQKFAKSFAAALDLNLVKSGLPAPPKNYFWPWAWTLAAKHNQKKIAIAISKIAPRSSLYYVSKDSPEGYDLDGAGVDDFEYGFDVRDASAAQQKLIVPSTMF